MSIPVVIDVDTGVDDALALLYALAHPALDVRAVTCVAGNARIDRAVTNTICVLDAAGASDIPVGRGAAGPLLAPRRSRQSHHGGDGLGGLDLPPPSRRADGTATEVLSAALRQSGEPITLVALGPQTNVAVLLRDDPDALGQLAHLVVMGGRVSAASGAPPEFNVAEDPEAAAKVLGYGGAVTLYPLDLFDVLTVGHHQIAALAESRAPAAPLAASLLRRQPAPPLARTHRRIGDAGALMQLARPELFALQHVRANVSLAGESRGQLVLTSSEVARDGCPASIELCVGVDAPAAARDFASIVGGGGGRL